MTNGIIDSKTIGTKDYNLWTDKYRPKCIKDIVGNKENLKIIDKWINDFKNKVEGHKKVLLISGEPGIGKTSTAHIILRQYGYRILEHNASDIRGKKAMNIIIRQSLSYTNILDLMNGGKQPVAIILDEIDNLVNGGGEKGGMSTFLEIIKSDVDIKSRSKKIKNKIIIYNPIICIYNEFSDKLLNELKKYSVHVEFNKPTKKDISFLLNKVIKNEKINIVDDAKNKIIDYCNYDFRRLINILHYIFSCDNLKKLTLDGFNKIKDSFSKKDKTFFLKDNIYDILCKKKSIENCLYISGHDRFHIPLYLFEHICHFINYKDIKEPEKFKNYFDILNSLSTNDNVQTYIFLEHYWELYKYSGLFGCAKINYLLHQNNFKKTFYKSNKKELNFPYLLTKLSQKGSNKKKILNIINELKHVKINFTLDIIRFLTEFIYFNVFSENGSLENLAKYMFIKNIKFEDLELILKLKKFNTIKILKIKKITKKIKKKLISFILYNELSEIINFNKISENDTIDNLAEYMFKKNITINEIELILKMKELNLTIINTIKKKLIALLQSY